MSEHIKFKPIKFNLICDNQSIRTLDDLRDNFCVEDVLEYFNNGLLEKWLTVRNYNKELEAIKKIKKGSTFEIIEAICNVLDIKTV